MALFSTRIFSKILLSASLVFSLASAHAEVVFFNFTGKVLHTSGSLSSVAVGSQVNGSFSYDANIGAEQSWPDYVIYQINQPSHMQLRFGNHQANSSDLAMAAVVNLDSSLFRLDIGHAQQLQFDQQAAAPYAYLAFSLYTDWNRPVYSLDLPRNFSTFDLSGQPGASDGLLALGNHNSMGFSIDSVTSAVPEPETYAMLALGLLALGLGQRRRHTQVSGK